MHSLYMLYALAAMTTAASVDLNKRASPLVAKLTHVNGTHIHADITNTGSAGYNVLYTGTILDDAPTDDLIITSAKASAKFNGISVRPLTTNLTNDAFVSLAAGQTVGRDIDIAEIYDTSTDNYDISATGTFPYAEANSTSLTGRVLSFSSNKINVDIDGEVAAKVNFRVYGKVSSRTDVDSDCTGDQQTAVDTALSNCQKLATAASNAAANGHGTIFASYFKTESARPDVAARLKAVAEDCASQTSGATTTSCSDTYDGCSSQVLAYTVVQRDAVVLCPAFFDYLPALANGCHTQDQATTIIHENTHAPAVYSPGTSDNGYGYAAATSLSSSQALLNADSYALYSNAIYLDCQGSGSGTASSDGSGYEQSAPSTDSTGESSSGSSDGTSTGSSSGGFPGWGWWFSGGRSSS